MSPIARRCARSKRVSLRIISPSRKKPKNASVQIAHSIMVSCSVADELHTILIARRIEGVMGRRCCRLGSGGMLIVCVLATPICTACNLGIMERSGAGKSWAI